MPSVSFITLVSLIHIKSINTACQTVQLLTDIGLDIATDPIYTDSKQCQGAWTNGYTCLRNVEYFEEAISNYLWTLNSNRHILRSKMLQYYDELMYNRITDETKPYIFNENNKRLVPNNPKSDKYKFSINFDHCFEDLNTLIVEFICYLTSATASDHFSTETSSLTISDSYVYSFLRNCLEMGKTFCVFFKYFEYLFIQKIGAEATQQTLGAYIEFCNNTVTECAGNYSSEYCFSEFKISIVLNLFSLRGIGSQSLVIGLMYYVFEGVPLDMTRTIPSNVYLKVSEDGYSGEVRVTDIDYFVGSFVASIGTVFIWFGVMILY